MTCAYDGAEIARVLHPVQKKVQSVGGNNRRLLPVVRWNTENAYGLLTCGKIGHAPHVLLTESEYRGPTALNGKVGPLCSQDSLDIEGSP